MGVRNWRCKTRNEKTGGQFWKRLRSTKDCNATTTTTATTTTIKIII